MNTKLSTKFTKLSLFLLVLVSLFQFSFAERMMMGTRFMNWSFDEASHQAKVINKPIFIFCYSNTCLQSKRMEDVFKMKQVSNFLNKNYVCNKYETEGFGHRIQATKWGVKSYPSFIIFDRTGKLIVVEAGYKKHDDILAFIKDGLEKAIASSGATPLSKQKLSDKQKEKEEKEAEVPEAENVN